MGVTDGSGVGEEWPTTGVLLSLRYRLTGKLASSGMSEVWQANDELLGRSVAIKLPRPQAAEILHQAWTEARTTARLSHPHIAAVHDYGEALRPDDSVAPYVVMELLDGESLAARLTSGPLTWPEAARIGADVAAGLAAAHARRVVHRDIKPGNVMLTSAGAKILDFGISAATGTPDDDETGATFGTPAYVAPERLNGTPVEPATDVYALGTVLYEMVNGEPPYPVDTWEEYAAARAAPPDPLPDGLPAAFRELVERCLAEDPLLRPEATEVRDRLSALRAPDRTPGPAGIRMPVAVRWAMIALLVAVGVVAGLGSWVIDGNDRPTATPHGSEPPPATAPSAVPGTDAPPPPSSTTAEPIETVASVIAAVQAGRAAGQIRDDVAVDLINLLRHLDDAAPQDVSRRVAELQQKIRDRIAEGGLTKTYADELQNRLARIARA
jgi:eukaryotic-like serine/threonine-protein kinase